MPSTSSPRSEYYRRCDQLPLDRFIRCLLDSDLSALVISGSPGTEELAVAWGEIYYEYLELSQDSDARYLYSLQRDIQCLQSEIANVETALYFLAPVMLGFSRDRAPELINIINDYGYKVKFSVDGPEYPGCLDVVNNKLAPKRLRLDSMLRELNGYLEARAGDRPDRTYFDRLLIRLSKYQGYPVRAREVTVAEFVIILHDYLSYIESVKEKKEADGTAR